MYILHILYILANRSNIGIYCTILYTILERLGLQMHGHVQVSTVSSHAGFKFKFPGPGDSESLSTGSGPRQVQVSRRTVSPTESRSLSRFRSTPPARAQSARRRCRHPGRRDRHRAAAPRLGLSREPPAGAGAAGAAGGAAFRAESSLGLVTRKDSGLVAARRRRGLGVGLEAQFNDRHESR